jgi:hypothetical protein
MVLTSAEKMRAYRKRKKAELGEDVCKNNDAKRKRIAYHSNIGRS